MAQCSENNPLPPCPVTPNCVRTSKIFDAGVEIIFAALSKIFEEEAHTFEVLNPKRVEIHAVYRIPLFGFKDDVDVILEEKGGKTLAFIRSASRLGAYDLGVNKRRVNRIFKMLESKIHS
ncbi:DUF1499 domain-containing protein [Gracilimonas tropica]|uniref:DUF1499 domain-containing protein n=1 Tax=Gracilimonas tropica TaxID=454600 RepID=UPI000369ADBD|nr:DUF1499 domain-containing protein [Gracilimonas tropica]